MEILNSFLDILSIPFLNFVKSTGRLSWIYLSTAAIIGFFTILVTNLLEEKFSSSKFLHEVFDFSHWTEKSSYVDYLYYFIETILYTFFFSYFVITSYSISIATFKILLLIGGEQAFVSNYFIQFLFTLIFLLAYDFGRFYAHRLFHLYPILWEFHKFHHSAKSLTPFTVYRVHPVESIILNSFSGFFSGISVGLFIYFFPFINMFSFLGVNFGLFLFHIYSNLRHSQVWLPFPRWLSFILLSPAQHQIHHSKDSKHIDKNQGSIFGFWDYFCNTLYIPDKKEELQYGLNEEENPEDYSSLIGIFFIPFKRAYQALNKK